VVVVFVYDVRRRWAFVIYPLCVGRRLPTPEVRGEEEER
jgi:hypothetical protein